MAVVIAYYYGAARVAGDFLKSAFTGTAMLIGIAVPLFGAAMADRTAPPTRQRHHPRNVPGAVHKRLKVPVIRTNDLRGVQRQPPTSRESLSLSYAMTTRGEILLALGGEMDVSSAEQAFG